MYGVFQGSAPKLCLQSKLPCLTWTTGLISEQGMLLIEIIHQSTLAYYMPGIILGVGMW